MVDSHVVKKNGRNIFKSASGRMFPGKSSRLIAAERDMILHLISAKNKLYKKGLKFPIDQYCNLNIQFYFDNFFTKKGIRSKNIPDLSNLYELVQDCLTKAGVIEDDYLIESHDGSRRCASDRINKISIEITY